MMEGMKEGMKNLVEVEINGLERRAFSPKHAVTQRRPSEQTF
jgi:hypothetical protein